MRAARLLRILILLQNRGRLTSRELAEELEVDRRTILRDVDAMTEAGLPVIVHRGALGGIELGFNYRTRLTGLAEDEAEAIGILLSQPGTCLAGFGLADAGRRATDKLFESLPDRVRAIAARAADRFAITAYAPAAEDPRIAAMADAIRTERFVTLRARSNTPRTIRPHSLRADNKTWRVGFTSDDDGQHVSEPISDWGDLNISNLPPAPVAGN
ncbi:MAG: HTH domain-containing protein [Hyphomicrobiaceae bacterium]|nr:HTH domain-containing protein [Hyphomicrobiaceae bacterium]